MRVSAFVCSVQYLIHCKFTRTIDICGTCSDQIIYFLVGLLLVFICHASPVYESLLIVIELDYHQSILRSHNINDSLHPMLNKVKQRKPSLNIHLHRHRQLPRPHHQVVRLMFKNLQPKRRQEQSKTSLHNRLKVK